MPVIPIVNTAQRATVGISAVLIVLPCMAVGLRLYARHLKGDWLDLSDYLIVAGLLFSIGYSAISISLVVNCGVGVSALDVVLEYGMGPIQLLVREIIALPILCVLANSCVKLSLLTFYCRIFNFRYFLLAARVIAVVIVVLTVASILCSALLCRPDLSNYAAIQSQCSGQILAYVITGSLILATDFTVLAMPLPYLWKLNMKQPQKSLVFGMFAIGLFTCIASTMRIIYNSQLNYSNMNITVTKSLIWGGIEPSLGATLACAPFMHPLFPCSRATTQYYDYTQSSNRMSSAKRKFKQRNSFHPYDPYPLQTFVTATGTGMDGTTVQNPSPPGSVTNASQRHILGDEHEREHEAEEPGMKIMVKNELDIRDNSSS